MLNRSRGNSYDAVFGDDTEQVRENKDDAEAQDVLETTTGAGATAGSPGQNTPQSTRNESAVATAIDKLMSVTTRTLEEEIKWQLGNDVSKEEIAQQTEITVFMFLRPNSPERAVSLVHSIAQCWITGHARGKYVGVTGDATEAGNTLTAVALQEQKTWALVKKTISLDMEELTGAVEGDPTVKTKIWTSTNNTEEVEMPRIMHVPLCLAKHMYEEGKRFTPYDISSIVQTLYEDDVGILPVCWATITTWCMLAQQSDDVCLDVAAITEPDREFARWVSTRIANTLGYRHGQSTGGQMRQDAAPKDANIALANAVGQGVARAIMQQGTNHGVGSPTNRNNGGSKDTKEEYDIDEKATLMSFCHVTKWSDVPQSWRRMVNKRPEIARKIVMELMTEAAYTKRVTLEQTFFIEEKNMKDIQKLRFNVGAVATYNSANDGLTPLICRGRSAREQAFLVKRETAMEETTRTRTLEDALAKPKYDPKFPDNFHDLKMMTDTFMIMIWVLFGEWSPLYVQLQQVSMLLSERQVQMTARAYSKGACYRIMWAIYEEVRRFCDQGLLADAFRSTSRVAFPQAYINAFLNDIRVGNTIMRLSYPSELQKLEHNKEGGQGGGGRGGGGDQAGGGTGRGRGGNQNQQGGRGGRGMGGYYNNNNGGGGYNNYNNNNYNGGGGGYPNNGYNNNNNQARMPNGGNMNNGYNNYNNNNRGQGLKNTKIEARSDDAGISAKIPRSRQRLPHP